MMLLLLLLLLLLFTLFFVSSCWFWVRFTWMFCWARFLSRAAMEGQDIGPDPRVPTGLHSTRPMTKAAAKATGIWLWAVATVDQLHKDDYTDSEIEAYWPLDQAKTSKRMMQPVEQRYQWGDLDGGRPCCLKPSRGIDQNQILQGENLCMSDLLIWRVAV